MDIKNELIVEFLELRKCQLCNDCGGYHSGIYGEPTESNILVYEINRMKYHLMWDWLMPVVEKIESIWHKDHGYFGVYISSNSCTIQGTNFRPDASIVEPVYYSNIVLETKIESTYQCVIKFIEWYLKNIKNK